MALGGDAARRRRDVTANVALAVLGAGDRFCRVLLGMVACAMGRGLSWGGKGIWYLGYGFCSGPKST